MQNRRTCPVDTFSTAKFISTGVFMLLFKKLKTFKMVFENPVENV